MGRRRKIKCSSCDKALFYLPTNYTMSFSVLCVECEEAKEGKVKKAATPVTASARYARTKKGVRSDVHPSYCFRSATEANFARILCALCVGWKYEERVFSFPDAKNKPHQYIPDFEIVSRDPSDEACREFPLGWYEVKGWMDASSRNKLRRFKSKYPEEAAKLTVIVYRKGDKTAVDFCKKLGFRYLCYDILTEQYASQIPTWE